MGYIKFIKCDIVKLIEKFISMGVPDFQRGWRKNGK